MKITYGYTLNDKGGLRDFNVYLPDCFLTFDYTIQDREEAQLLHDYLWCLRLAELNDAPFSPQLRNRIRCAGELLYQLEDSATGRVPNFGQNDGALILPLNDCEYGDFRPVTQAVCYLESGSRCHPPGPWDEDLVWLFGPDAIKAQSLPRPQQDVAAPAGAGWSLRAPSGFAFIRCGEYRHRPSHADALHVDLWWKGEAVATDAGTYSYSAPPPWDNPLARTAYHNTVTVDGLDQMQRVDRFLWLPWLKSRMRVDCRSDKGALRYCEAEHDGYQRLRHPVEHRRAVVRLGDQGWLVLDYLHSCSPHQYRLHWLVPMASHTWSPERGELQLRFPAGSYRVLLCSQPGDGACSLISGDPDSPAGWMAGHYRDREPALSLTLTIRRDAVWFCSGFTPDECTLKMDADTVKMAAPQWRASLSLSSLSRSLVESISIEGIVNDGLKIEA